MKALEKVESDNPGMEAYKVSTLARSMFDETDVGNADRLMLKYGSRLAYTSAAGWIAFDGKRWNRESGEVDVIGCAGEIAREIKFECGFLDDKSDVSDRIQHAKSSGRSNALKGMTFVAQSGLKTSIDVFDQQPHLFNAANGTIDLTTGDLRPFNADDMLTHMSSVEYDETAAAPTWDRFIDDIMCGDAELISFLQRLIGYAMFGHQEENIAAFLTGDEKDAGRNGSNGKSLFLFILGEAFDEYSTGVDRSLIVEETKKSGINSDVAALSGRRLGIGSEFKRNDVINDKEFKALTGEDTVQARFLRHEYFNFVSQALLIYATNHIPLMTGQDNGLKRRTVIIPFLATFHDARDCPAGGRVKDPKLKSKLIKELPGILAWCVRGAVEYSKTGLRIPEKLFQRRDDKFAEFDPFSDFMSMCVEFDEGAFTDASQIQAAYRMFSEFNEGKTMSTTALGRRLSELGCEKDDAMSKRARKTIRRGLRLTETGQMYARGTQGLAQINAASPIAVVK